MVGNFLIWSSIERLQQSAISVRESIINGTAMDTLGTSALSLALFFFVYVLFEVSLKLLSGQQFPWMDVIKPFMLILVIVNWSPLIRTVDIVGNYLNENVSIAFKFDESQDRYETDLKSAMASMESLEKKLDEVPSSDEDDLSVSSDSQSPNTYNEDRLGKKIVRGIGGLLAGVVGTLNIGTPILLLLKKLIGDVLAVLSQFYLIVLVFLGPFAFAFAIIPSMNRISQWIGTYLQYWLWVPMINIITSIVSRFNSGLAVTEAAFGNGKDSIGALWDNYASLGESWLTRQSNPFGYLEFTNVATIAAIFLLLSVPKLARLVVQSGEDVLSGNLGRFASQTLTLGAQALTGRPGLPKSK